MNTHRTRILFFMLLAAFALAGCALWGQGDPSTPVFNPADSQAEPTQVVAVMVTPTAQAAMQPTLQPRTRGTGEFNLLDPAVGLRELTAYHTSLEMAFEGTRDGAPYQLKRSYEQVIERALDGRWLVQTATGPDGATTRVFSAAFSGVRYLQPAADQPCRAGVLDVSSAEIFEPASMLPLLEGASAAGTETVNELPAEVYTFDTLALNAGADAQASGKLWIATDGGYLVKYELSLRSDTLFGAGISGEQRWSYNLSEVGTAQFDLPPACPQGEVDLPLPEGAQVRASLPNFLQLASGQSPEALVAFYNDSLLALSWTKQGEPVVSPAGTRLVFSRSVQDQEQMAVITITGSDGGSAVTIFQLLTDPVVAPQ